MLVTDDGDPTPFSRKGIAAEMERVLAAAKWSHGVAAAMLRLRLVRR